MGSWGTNHDLTPPSKVQRPDAQEESLRASHVWVGAMELSDKSLGALDIVGRVPLIFFDTIPLPAY